MVAENRRAQAVAMVMSGLTVATIIGVPAANWLGQALGWRAGFAVVSVLALMTMASVALFAPHQPPAEGASAARELSALRRPQVLLTLLTGAIGFGGLFAVYTYVASTMIEVTKVSEGLVPVVLAVFGVGMTVGNLFWAWAADRAQSRAAIGALLFSAFSLALFPFAAGSLWSLIPVILMVGFSGGLGTILQTRLMDVAGEAQALAAAAHHSAFNFANALGPWLGGLAISAGWGLTSTGWIGAGLSLGGLAVFLLTLLHHKRGADMDAAPACAYA